ncbi:MAG: hypothetical protein II684_04355 [Treponema sp.]|nr:hypothetical protein [Treponema sp.]
MKKFSAVLLSLLLSVFCSALFFETLHADHDCSGDDDCAVCLIIQAVRANLRAADSNPVHYLLHTPALLLTAGIAAVTFFFIRSTPVSIKIRMND